MRAYVRDVSKRLSREGLYEFLSSQFDQMRSSDTVLTVGSGGRISALLNEHAAKRGFRLVSLDIDATREPDIVADVCDHDFGDLRFDWIVMSEVLEHIHAPHVALANIRGALKHAGRLVITTPFLLPIHEQPRDYYRYTRYGLAYLLRDFDEVTIRARNNYFQAIDVLWVRLWQSGSARARFLCLFVVPLVYFVKRPLSALLGRLVPTDTATTGYNVTCKR